MLFVINLILFGLAGLLVLVLAASVSLPANVVVDLESPEGEWMGPTRPPENRVVKIRPPILAVRMPEMQAADLPASR